MNIDEKVYLSDYNVNWETQFIDEKKLLQTCFHDVPIEHIGSTSVKGMTAKPIIDIMLGTIIYPPPEEMIKNFEELKYLNLGEIDKTNGRFYFVKRSDINYNVHVVKHLGILWSSNILFRDYLRTHENKALEYSKIKQDIINKGVDTLLRYSDEKREFISNIMKKINARK